MENSAELQVVAPEKFGAAAADVLQAALHVNPAAVIGFPTGSTPQPLYRELRRRMAARAIDTARMRAVMLDDYFDSADLSTNSYQWLKREVFDPLALAPERLLPIPTNPLGIEAACRHFESDLRAWGGCDLQFLGLGANGHIGFNEPGASPDSRTRVVELSAETARANAAYWQGAFTPTAAVTMGVGTILEARKICLLVMGDAKAAVLRRVLFDPITSETPASFLRLVNNVLVLADTAAAAAKIELQ